MREKLYPLMKAISAPLIDKDIYEELYKRSIDDNSGFWAEQAEKELSWIKKWTSVSDCSFAKGDIRIKWFEGAKLNVCYNCVDRHLPEKANDIAIIWEGDDSTKDKKVTYSELKDEVCRFANVLKNMGVKKGDVVTIYMPMIVEAAYAMLACARIGAVHSVVFGGFSPEALKGRIEDCNSKLVITADEGRRGGKTISLKANVDEAVKDMKGVRLVVVKNTGGKVDWREGRDAWYEDEYEKVSAKCECVEMDAEDPLFVLYTSGSTGKPKGLVHTSAGYLLYTAVTHKYVFDYKEGDVYWCTADVGWITGHSYIVYAPLCNSATTLMFEGVPNYPDVSRFWQVVDKHKVNQFYTAPTAIRMLMAAGNEAVKKTDRSSLRILGSVGEPINPEAWRWYFEVVGDGRCPVVDTWWQTETGGFMITPLPYATELKAGSASKAFFGVEPVIVDSSNIVQKGNNVEGNLCIGRSWPGQARTIWGDHKRFEETYFSQFEGRYFSGDGCRKDEDGYYIITGRVDDVLNVSGHRIGTAEVESALVLHKDVAEAAVVGYPHDIKGQGIYAFVTLNSGVATDEALKKELVESVRKAIGSIAKPDLIQFAPQLPKTRSGKIMRRILRKIAENDFNNLGDTKTLLNPEAVEELINNRVNK